MTQIENDDIDLFELFQTLWDGKWKIVVTTLLASAICTVFVVAKPERYKITTPIKRANNSVFSPFTPINDLLRREGLSFHIQDRPNGYILDSPAIFKLFVREFSQYDEMIAVLSENEYVKQRIKGLSQKEAEAALVNFAKSFQIKRSTKEKDRWSLSLEWHDAAEGLRLVDNAIQMTLTNVQRAAKDNIENMASVIDLRNTSRLDRLRTELGVVEQMQSISDNNRIEYLMEHSAIARELGIESNKFDANSLARISPNSVSINVSSTFGPKPSMNDAPFYLRGYKAIEKEISLIRNRSHEQKRSMNPSFFKLNEKIVMLENDLIPSQLRTLSEMITISDPSNWVECDLTLADIDRQKKPFLLVVMSIIIGVLIGSTYVLISNATSKRMKSPAKA